MPKWDPHQRQYVSTPLRWGDILTLVLLNPDIFCLCKQCRSRSVGFWRSQPIWICSVYHSVYEFMSTVLIKASDWLIFRSEHDILIYSAWQGLINQSAIRWIKQTEVTEYCSICGQYRYRSARIFAESNQGLSCHLTLLLLNMTCPVLADSVDLDLHCLSLNMSKIWIK